jgi:hypothetical protein
MHPESPPAAAPLSELNSIRDGRAEPWRRLAGRNSTKADVLLYRLDGLDVAVKDYGPRPFLIRNTVGRFLIRRESHAYAAAAGISGLPSFLGRLGPYSLALQYVDARPLAEDDRPRDDAFFDGLDAVVGELHTRGIALGDLHHGDVLVTAGDDLYIVDLATAWVAGESAGPVRRAIFRRLCDLDRVAAARMRARWTGGDPDKAAASVGRSIAAWHLRGRRLKSFWNRIRRRGA